MNKVTCPQCWGERSHPCDKCDRTGELYDVQLSKNFRLSELVASPTARRKNIPNSPTTKEVDRLRELTTKLLQPLRDALGTMKITSGFRSRELNTAIGGARDSAHMLAYAADCQPEHADHEDILYWFKQGDLQFDQVILEYGKRENTTEDDWVHVGYKDSAGRQRRQFLVMKNGVYTPWRG
jgi:zinc D-Ala-D-Ala carboxypeptidase